MALKLISLNIERSKHFDRVLPFLAREAADVVCLQEVREEDVPVLAEVVGGVAEYAPMYRFVDDPTSIIGICIISRYPINARTDFYALLTHPGDAPVEELPDRRKNQALLYADIEKNGVIFSLVTTHFSWSWQGRATDIQRRDVAAMIELLEKNGEYVLVGDFNAPRGGEIFGKLAEKYKDNIPPEYVTSLDPSLHRAGKEKLAADARAIGVPGQMVDGLFTTPGYSASDVRLIPGISDHCAIVATITKST